MIAVLQRAASAFVRVEGSTVGEIGKGLLILLGVGQNDSEREAEMLAAKILRCRIFTDEADKLNLSVTDVGGGALVVSNLPCLPITAGATAPILWARLSLRAPRSCICILPNCCAVSSPWCKRASLARIWRWDLSVTVPSPS